MHVKRNITSKAKMSNYRTMNNWVQSQYERSHINKRRQTKRLIFYIEIQTSLKLSYFDSINNKYKP